MAISRRDVLLGSAGAAGAAAFSFPVPAIAQSEPVKVGCLAAMTGPSSAPTIGFNRGVMFAAEAINAAGGIKGRKLEIVMRDTQGDPTKAVNATQELISQAKVHAIWGPLNSGEALATTPIMARAKIPDIHPCVVETLIDTTKFPNAFRMAPSNSQWDDAVRNYCLNILKVKKIAVIGDTTGYGVTAVGASVAAFKKDGADVVYQANVDATQPDMTPDMLRAKNAGAEAIVVWSVSTGMEARMFNVRAVLNWDVPFVGHPSMGGLFFAKRPPATYREWKTSDYTFYDTMAYHLHDLGIICEPDSREPWFMCEAHADADIIDRVLTAFSDSLDAALESRAHGGVHVTPHGGMAAPAAG